MTYTPILEKKHNAIILNRFFYYYPKLFHYIISTFSTLEDIANSTDTLSASFKLKNINKLRTIHLCSSSNELDFIKQHNISLLTLNSPQYPTLLKEITFPPPVLFIKGNTNCLTKPSLGIVGPRIPSDYGRYVTTSFTKELSSYFCIISGFAQGIDTIAHETCLNAGGSTVAVLGTGLDKCYPAKNKSLMKILLQNNGLFLTEIPLFSNAERFHFPLRNRLISGLSQGILLPEAKEKSGSLITAQHALEQNREVFAIPGPIHSEHSHGTNKLIQQGAKCTLTSKDIFDELNLSKQFPLSSPTPNPKPDLIDMCNETEKCILNQLSQPKHIDDIIKSTALDIQEVLHTLTFLEIKQAIKKTSSNYYSLL